MQQVVANYQHLMHLSSEYQALSPPNVIYKFNLLSLQVEGLRQLNEHPHTQKMD